MMAKTLQDQVLGQLISSFWVVSCIFICKSFWTTQYYVIWCLSVYICLLCAYLNRGVRNFKSPLVERPARKTQRDRATWQCFRAWNRWISRRFGRTRTCSCWREARFIPMLCVCKRNCWKILKNFKRNSGGQRRSKISHGPTRHWCFLGICWYLTIQFWVQMTLTQFQVQRKSWLRDISMGMEHLFLQSDVVDEARRNQHLRNCSRIRYVQPFTTRLYRFVPTWRGRGMC